MTRKMRAFKNFEEAAEHERLQALSRTPEERIILLHKLIAAWMKFPRLTQPVDESGIPVLKRKKRNAR